MKIKIQENKILKEKLDIAKNEIIELQEKIEEKDQYQEPNTKEICGSVESTKQKFSEEN